MTVTLNRNRILGGAAVALFALAFAGGSHPVTAQSGHSPCDIQTDERVVAVGDVHGAYDQLVDILRTAGLVDRRNRWIGGRAILIQTGDVLDRGADSRKAVDLLRQLERDAQRAGGRVFPLLGNHEFMRLVGDWRYVSPEEFEAFERMDSMERREALFERSLAAAMHRASMEGRRLDEAAYREQFMKDIPPGYIEMRLAFDPKGDYGKWIRTQIAAVKVNGVLFLHGGISEEVAALGCDGINDAIRKDLMAVPIPAEQVPSLLSSSETGPLWYRGLATEPEDVFEPTLTAILDRVGARAIVVGHTPVASGRIATRFGGRVVLIDTGMLNGPSYPGGMPSALELRGTQLTAIYPEGRERLQAPGLQTAAAR
jgi:hypothetical protein